jgi:hypothetical protein
MISSRSFFASLAVLMLVGCGASQARKTAGPTKNPNLITHEEIAAVMGDNDNAYDVIRRLRPSFLRTRGVSTMGRSDEPVLVVYLDMVKVAGTSYAALKGISSAHIRSIEYLNGIDATTRFGTDHGAGAILVSTRGPVE